MFKFLFLFLHFSSLFCSFMPLSSSSPFQKYLSGALKIQLITFYNIFKMFSFFSIVSYPYSGFQHSHCCFCRNNRFQLLFLPPEGSVNIWTTQKTTVSKVQSWSRLCWHYFCLRSIAQFRRIQCFCGKKVYFVGKGYFLAYFTASEHSSNEAQIRRAQRLLHSKDGIVPPP